MSIFHETMRDILEDVQKFLNLTLQHEHLSAASISHKESLLMKIHHLRTEYPQLHLQIISEPTSRNLGSPPPYIDMQGNRPATEYVYSDTVEEDYEICDGNSQDARETKGTLDLGNSSGDNKEQSSNIPMADVNDVLKCGYLEKKGKDRLGGLLSMSQKRWVAVKFDCLLFYNKSGDKRPISHLSLDGYDVRQFLPQVKDGNKKDAFFELIGPGKKSYQFVAANQGEAKEWTDAIQKAISNVATRCSSVSTVSTTIPIYSDGSQGSSSDGSCSLRIAGTDSGLENDSSRCEDVYEAIEEGELHSMTESEDLYQDTDADGEPSNSFDGKQPYPLDLYVGLWDCKASASDELNFKRGDIIKIISKDYDEYQWWVGESNGIVGLVPKQYLMEAYEIDPDR